MCQTNEERRVCTAYIGLEPSRPQSCAILSPRRAAQTELLCGQEQLPQ
jgi:hypothetical protein